ncbi:MAG: hypothetical protein KDB94_02515, partial [Acidobacteria bacterium]|nr:hypothetical protein [Acidobacteriota bacterium]
MKRRVSGLVGALTLAAAALALPPRASSPTDLASVPESPLPPLPAADGASRAAGAALRSEGFGAARRQLEPLTTGESAEARLARVHLGLLAAANDHASLAESLLAAGAGPDELEDWRLFVLADAAAEAGHPARSRAALERLLADRPESPLREREIVRLADVAWQERDAPTALARVAQGRGERLPAPSALELERLAWQIGVAQRDLATLADAGRRLLIEFPLEASKLKVVDALAARGGPSDWQLWLRPEELVRRAEALLGSDLPAGALTTLAAVPAEARGFEWRLLEARALTASGRGREALDQLAPALPAVPGDTVRLEWERARAASDAASVRRGRANLPAAERERYATRART